MAYERRVGTVSRGIRCPIIREGDDLAQIVVDSVTDAAREESFSLHDKDVVAVTESVSSTRWGTSCPWWGRSLRRTISKCR